MHTRSATMMDSNTYRGLTIRRFELFRLSKPVLEACRAWRPEVKLLRTVSVDPQAIRACKTLVRLVVPFHISFQKLGQALKEIAGRWNAVLSADSGITFSIQVVYSRGGVPLEQLVASVERRRWLCDSCL